MSGLTLQIKIDTHQRIKDLTLVLQWIHDLHESPVKKQNYSINCVEDIVKNESH